MRKKDQIKINDVDIDTWLDTDKEQLEETPAEETTRKYDKKLVAVLDLLGISNRILDTEDGKEGEGKEGEVIACLRKAKDIVVKEAREYTTISKLDLLQLSDSFVFSCSEDLLPQVLNLLCMVQMRILIECHTMLRGALEYGNVIFDSDESQIIGPAFIYAYRRQENDAIYPRIIISNAVTDLIRTRFPEYSSIIVTYDRESALDFVKVYCERERGRRIVIPRLKRTGVYTFLIDQYKYFHAANKCHERRKYGWIINYFKDKGVWPNEPKYNNW